MFLVGFVFICTFLHLQVYQCLDEDGVKVSVVQKPTSPHMHSVNVNVQEYIQHGVMQYEPEQELKSRENLFRQFPTSKPSNISGTLPKSIQQIFFVFLSQETGHI